MPQHDLYNEKQLLLQLIEGHEPAFANIYEHYAPRLYFKLLKILKSAALAEEVLQEVFLVLWKHRAKINVEKSFRSYLFRIAANKAYDLFRKSLKDRKLQLQLVRDLPLEYGNAETNIIKKESTGILYKVVELLPPRRRTIFKLCKFEGKTYDEISLQLGISTSTVSDHIVKANHFIKSQLVSTIF